MSYPAQRPIHRDCVGLQRVDFLKLDCEGCEWGLDLNWLEDHVRYIYAELLNNNIYSLQGVLNRNVYSLQHALIIQERLHFV